MEWTIFFYLAAFLLPRTGNLLSKRLEGADGVPLITSTFSAENNAPRFFLGQVHDLQRWERQADSKDF